MSSQSNPSAREGSAEPAAAWVVEVREEERRRIARELHDALGSALAGQLAELAAIEARAGDEALAGELARVRAALRATLEELRRISRDLHAGLVERDGLGGALERLVREAGARHGLVAELDVAGLRGAGRLPAAVELGLFRIVQEALANVARHAQARSVSVVVAREGAGLRLLVEDDGRGFPMAELDARRGLGLRSMAERAAALGARLVVDSAPGRGTTLLVATAGAEVPRR